MAGSLTYTKGDATAPEPRPAIIAHVCNDEGAWGKGFVMALSEKWSAPEQAYRDWYASGEEFALGAVQVVEVEDGLCVANIIGQHGIRPQGPVPPIRYEAIEAGLCEVAKRAADQGASVHMPRIGAGLAGGSWEKIEPLIEKCLVEAGVDVTVYDLP